MATTETSRGLMEAIGDRKRTITQRVDSVRQLLVSQRSKLESALGGLLSPDRVIQISCNSIRKNPELLDCTPKSMFGAIAEAATYGWVPDGMTGYCYMIPFKNRRQVDGEWKKVAEVTLVPGYKGLRELIRRSGEMDTVMSAVHEGDEFEYRGPFSLPLHKPGDDPQRRHKRSITGAYVLGQWFKSGRVKCFYWSVDECICHRDRYSQGWRRVKDDPQKRKDSPWNSDNVHEFSVMCCKTVLADAIHRGEFPISIEDRRMVERDPEIAARVRKEAAGTEETPVDVEGMFDDLDETPSEAVQDAPESSPAESKPVAHPSFDEAQQERLNGLAADLERADSVTAVEERFRHFQADTESVDEELCGRQYADRRIAEIKSTRGERSNAKKKGK